MIWRIPLTKPTVGKQELEAVERVFRSGTLTTGPETERFEREFAEWLGVKHAVATSSGTSALHLALLCLDVKQGDEVIVPDYTFSATANVVKHCGATPVLCDIRLDEFQIDPDEIEKLITEKTVAIIPVSEFGLTCDWKPIKEISEKHEITIIEDACPALGSFRDGKKAGAWSYISCFSFHPRKPLAIGEGGMLVTNSDLIAESARVWRNHGQTEKWQLACAGYNYRLSDVQSAIGRVQLRKLHARIESQRRIASTYNYYFQNYGMIKTPCVPDGCFHTYQSYVIQTSKPNIEVIQKLRNQGIEAQVGTNCLHLLEPYKNVPRGDCSNSFYAWNHAVTLPLYQNMNWQDQMEVVNSVLKCVGVPQASYARIN